MKCRSLAVLLLLAACAAKPPVRTALRGNLADLKRDIESARRAGQLDNSAVVKLAQAVVERELTSADGASGAQRVRSLRPCARPVQRRMSERARASDEVAAELTLILLETHAVDRRALLNRYARSPSGAWRAVAASAAVRSVDTDLRQAFFSDPDQRVRRAAFGAARDARDERELEPLLEAARLDPDPLSHSLAVRAVGALGGERAVLALKDLWARGDDTLRIAIVDAWAEPASYAAGGERELSLAAETGSGLARVSASYALARAGGAQSTAANAQLRRDVSEGTDDERRLALSIAPLNSETEASIVKAASAANPELRVIALSRLVTLPKRRDDAIRALSLLASNRPSSEIERRAQGAALSALAQAGEMRVTAQLVARLHDPDAETRRRAARALTSLGDYTSTADALADDDSDVRSDVACAILARDKRR